MAKVPVQKNIPVSAAKQTKPLFAANKRLVLILGLVSLLAYANTFKNSYALDDFIVLKNNTIVTKGISAIPELLSTPYHKGSFTTTNDLYRPLSLVMFAIEYQVSGGTPAISHFINVLLFVCCVVLLFLFLDALFEKKKTSVAFIATLLFALHPIHTEVVANIKSRDELLCFFFGFLAINVFIKYTETGKMKQLITAAICFFLALLSKETIITFLAVIPFIFFFYRNENKKRSAYITASAVIAALLFLAIRFSVLNAYHANDLASIPFIDNPLAHAPSFAVRLSTAMLVLGNYIKLLFIPYPLICDYSYNSIPFVTFSNVWALLSSAIYIFLALFSIYLLMKDRKNPFAFAILFYLITISLFSNIPILIGAEMAERFVFFSSAGFCLAVALAIEKWIGRSADSEALLKNKTVTYLLVAIGIVYAGITINRNSDWADNTTLFKTDVTKSPNNARLYYYLGNDQLISSESDQTDPATKMQLINDGISNLKKSLTIYPSFALAASQIGHEYFMITQYDSAIQYNLKAIALDPTDTNAHTNLAGSYFQQKKYQQSLDVCKEAVTLYPNYVRGYMNMGICYQYMNKYDSAVYFLMKAVSINPSNTASYKHLAKVYRLMGNVDSANKYETIMQ